MTPLLIMTCVAAALSLGVVVGWSSRRHARWCPGCGGTLICFPCETARRENDSANNRVRVYPLGPGNSGPGGPFSGAV
jgi:hypothetical protein